MPIDEHRADQKLYLNRPPRIQPEMPIQEIEIPEPPERREDGWMQIVRMALPFISILGLLFVSSSGGGNRVWIMIPMMLMVVGSVGFNVYSFLRERKEQKEQEQAYLERLAALTQEMHHYHDLQRYFYRYNYPDPYELLRIVATVIDTATRQPKQLRAESRLWQRRSEDVDFGVVRVGEGTLPSTVIYKSPRSQRADTPMMRSAEKLAADSMYVSDIPFILRLSDHKQQAADASVELSEAEKTIAGAPCVHAVGIAGANRDAVYRHARAMLADYIAFHDPDDAKLLLIAQTNENWAWLEQVSHCQADDQNTYLYFIEEANNWDTGAVRFDEDAVDTLDSFTEQIRRTLSQRKIRNQTQEQGQSAQETASSNLPFLLIVVDMLDTDEDSDAGGEEARLSRLRADPAISIVLEEGNALGAAILYLASGRRQIPDGCQAIIEVEETPVGASNEKEHKKTVYRFAAAGLNAPKSVGSAAQLHMSEVGDLIRKLNTLALYDKYGGSLPRAVPFLSFMGHSHLDELVADTRQKWAASVQSEQAGWLGAKFAVVLGNKSRRLRFSADQDGVHGMIAGSTGSGKSEMLISMLLSMAVTYSPETLNFVLVDYKGGTAFNEFKQLPHCVDVITNLGDEGVQRMFAAIDAELKRRQALNAATGTANIVDYRRQGKHLNGGKPYPYLFIVIDEFAEMIASNPEFRYQLESITRTGRAQGVSLILAAQRPTGISEQMRSNIKFRICLRVETPAESREMLRRDAAAFLPPNLPGRGYLQVGNDEIEMVQVAYAGDKVITSTAPAGQITYTGHPAVVETPLYRALIQQLNSAAHIDNIPAQYAPWPDFLPTQLHLDDLLLGDEEGEGKPRPLTARRYLDNVDLLTHGREDTANVFLNPSFTAWMRADASDLPCGWVAAPDWKRHAMQAVIGLVDDPHLGKQYPLVWNMRSGHAVIFSAPGWGKTTFLRTLAVSLAATYSPRHLHMYVLDLGGRQLSALRRLPHVGAVISPYDEGYREQVQQLLRDAVEEADKRKLLLEKSNESTVYTYNTNHPDTPLPSIVILVDNFLEFRDSFGEARDNVASLLDKLTAFVRQSRDYGIHFVFTAGQPGEFSSQLYAQCTERFVLKMTDASSYREVVGSSAGQLGNVHGRGYVARNNRALLMQVAELTGVPGRDAAKQTHRAVTTLAQRMTDYLAAHPMTYPAPFAIGPLRSKLLFHELIEQRHQMAFSAAWKEELHELQRQLWAENLTTDSPRWLETALGVTPGDRLCNLHLSAAQDGVHGLIAGGTGSGKSELLVTFIANLAIHYDPAMLNFILVDFKGGGTFKPFAGLPHVVQAVDNLNKSAVQRMFVSIRAEMERRQQVNKDNNVSDIVEYRKHKLHLNGGDPYPHLVIIIDEYAEMITENPDFQPELDSITRLGRALGVHLILASQRPIGVTDQMRDNIKLRICLRVQEAETSREVLRRSDAAFLAGIPGRGYLQVGNEDIELIQVAYLGDTVPVAADDATDQGSLLDAICEVSQSLADGRAPQSPWPPELPAPLATDHLLNPRYLDATHEGSLRLQPTLTDWLNQRGQWPTTSWTRSAMRVVVGALDEPHRARQTPFVLDVRKDNAVIFGGPGWGKTSFLRSLILSAAATHSPADLHIYIIDMGRRELAELKQLPHTGAVILPDEGGFEERVQQLMRDMEEMIEARKPLFTDLYGYNEAAQRKGAPTYPAVLVVIDNFDEFVETFEQYARAEDNASVLDAFVALVRQSRAYGFHFVVTAGRPSTLSGKLYTLFPERLSLRLANPDDYSFVFGGMPPALDPIAGRGYVKRSQRVLHFQTAVTPVAARAGATPNEVSPNEMAQERAQLYVAMQAQAQGLALVHKPLSIEPLSTSISYRELLARVNHFDPAQNYVDQIKQLMHDQWQHSASKEDADWLRVLIGAAAGNRPRSLYWEAQADGVHGMIAGGTGSGKSEVLKTLIAGLALNYSPDVLNFVLVDYKGGGAFSAFKDLPHCVDLLTNLDKSSVDRMFTAITAEIERRQQLGEIVEYRRRGKHLNGGKPYPHLFIIIDEYAEMIEESEEYQEKLNSITRTGRAQGVHLLLAAQKPKGVTSQMRANIRMRLCLKVEERDTSVEMLSRPDAAQLPSIPGRGFLQIGHQGVELVQMAWSGEEIAADLYPASSTEQQSQSHEPMRFYDLIVRLAQGLVAQQQIVVRKPWPSELPMHYGLSADLFDSQENHHFCLAPQLKPWLTAAEPDWPGVDWQNQALRVTVGLQDDPWNARQEALRLDLRQGHTLIYGQSASGKTTMLHTLLINLAASHSPSEVHAHIIDMGGRGYGAVADLPQVGALLNSEDETFVERLRLLLRTSTREMNKRVRLLGEEGYEDVYAFNADPANRQRILPPVLLIIDNFIELYESYPDLVESYLIPIQRRSPARTGISVICTLATQAGITGSILNLFGHQLTLSQSNPDTYHDILGHKVAALSRIPGRGYVRKTIGRALLVQIAQPVDPAQGRLADVVTAMRNAVVAQPQRWTPLPDPFEPLPMTVGLHSLLEDDGNAAHVEPLHAVLGRVQARGLGVVEFNLTTPHLRIAGAPRSGRTTALYNLVLSLARRYSPQQVGFVLVDPLERFVRYGGDRSLAELPHTLAAVSDVRKMGQLVARLDQFLEESVDKPAVFLVIDDYDDFSDELNGAYQLSENLSDLIRTHGRNGLHVVVAGALKSGDRVYNRLRSSSQGLALRTAESLERLDVASRAAAVLKKELPVGRGYLVCNGELDLIQLAYPEAHGVADTAEILGASTARYGLDAWIDEINERWPDGSTAALPEVEEPSPDDDTTSSPSLGLGQPMYAANPTAQSEVVEGIGADWGIDIDALLAEPDDDPDDKPDREPRWDEPVGQLVLHEDVARLRLARQQIQLLVTAVMMAESISAEESATVFVETTANWDNYPSLVEQLRTLYVTYFDAVVDVEISADDLLAQIGRMLEDSAADSQRTGEEAIIEPVAD